MRGHASRHSGTRVFAVVNLPSADMRYPDPLKVRVLQHKSEGSTHDALHIPITSQWHLVHNGTVARTGIHVLLSQ